MKSVESDLLPAASLAQSAVRHTCNVQVIGSNPDMVNMIAWLLMQVVKRMATRKWSMSNMMTAVRILQNSYIGLFDFLNTPETQWLKIIMARRKASETPTELSLFTDMRGPNFENKKTMVYLQAVTTQ